MEEWETFLENYTSDREAMMAVMKALLPVIRKHSPDTMDAVFGALGSEKGQKLLHGLARNPSRSLAAFRQLVR